MSEATCLIDLSTEESTNLLLSQPPIPLQPTDMIIGFNKRDSLDNNPFDHALKQVNLLNDPFEIVFNEQRKQQNAGSQSINNTNVETANLIGTTDDSYLSQNKANCENPAVNLPINLTDCSSIDETQIPLNKSVIGKEELTYATVSSISLAKQQTITERHSSISGELVINSAEIVSPLTLPQQKIRSTSLDGTAQRLKLLKLSFTNSPKTQFSDDSLLMNGSSPIEDSFEENILMNEQLNLVDSDADSDIEQLKIPFLKKECKKLAEFQTDVSLHNIEEQLEKFKSVFVDNDGNGINVPTTTDDQPSADNSESNNKSSTSTLSKASSTNIDSLLDDLKKVVEQCQNEKMKSHATALLTNLGAVLNNNEQQPMAVEDDDDISKPVSVITRQGTFNMDDEDLDMKTINDENVTIDQAVLKTAVESTPKRSQSLSTNMKPNSVLQAIKTKQQFQQHMENSFATPVRSIAPRRNSFSAKSSFDRPNAVRRSIYSTIRDESQKNVSKFHQSSPIIVTPKTATLRTSSLMTPTSSSRQTTSSFPGAKKIISGVGGTSRLRVKATETQTKMGPLKATIPIKAVAPLLHRISSVVSAPSAIDSKRLHASSSSTPNPMNINSKPSAYSTPINISNRRHSSIATPIKNRTSYASSATPNPVKMSRIERQRSFTNLNTQSLYAAANTSTFGIGKSIDQHLITVRNESRTVGFFFLFLFLVFL